MKRQTVITSIILLSSCSSSTSPSATVMPTEATTESLQPVIPTSIEPTQGSAADESVAKVTEAPTPVSSLSVTATSAPVALTPELVARELSENDLCLDPKPFDRDPSNFSSMGLEAPTSEWQCRSTAGLVIIQAFPSMEALHDAAVAVSGAMAAHGANPQTASVLDLGGGLVLDANNGSDNSITPDLELDWLQQAQTLIGGTIVKMTDI